MFRHIAMHFEDHGAGPGVGRRCGREAHFADPGRHIWGHRHGPGGSRAEFGGGRERMFDGGEIRLVILQQLAEEPGYGYQLIKKLEERMSGGYTPSAGVIYPTLTMLEEQGLASVATSDSGKKIYTITDEGRAYLDANRERVQEIDSRLKEVGRGFRRGRSPQIMHAFMQLRAAVAQKATGSGFKAEQAEKIVEAIQQAVNLIEKL